MSQLLFFVFTIALLLASPSVAGDQTKEAGFRQLPLVLQYHNGLLLKGNLTINLVWYGGFTSSQRAIVTDFIRSLGDGADETVTSGSPTVSSWWSTTGCYLGVPAAISLGEQFHDKGYSLGKHLKVSDIIRLARRGACIDAITVVLTSSDVAVDGFCVSRCGLHRWVAQRMVNGMYFPFVWVGSSETQCPGTCAWPFYQPPLRYGPQTPPLVSPNGDAAMDGLVITLATLLAGTVTNPDGKGYFQGPATAPLEAVSACYGIFGSGAYPGYPGKVLIQPETGASYNAKGVAGREFLLPAMWDPSSMDCKTLV